MNETRILLFAKAPVPGRVKTRLIPALGATGAANLARDMLSMALDASLAAALGPVELCASPAITHADWREFPLPAGIEASDQGEGDLGARMARAAHRALRVQRPVLLIGADCPALDTTRLRAAATALRDHDAVLYPAFDGGYPLLGLGSYYPSLFSDMPWSTGEVATLTLARMRALGWRVLLGAALHDIDRPADLAHLPAQLRRPVTPETRS